MKNFAAAMLLLFTSIVLRAQENRQGRITGTTVEHASIVLLKASDSSVQKLIVADKSGAFEFQDLPFGNYRLSISAVGYQDKLTDVIEISAAQSKKEFSTIALAKEDKSLKAVTVTAKKQLIEIKPDRTVVNVDAGISNAGATALEVLEKSPGVAVDRDGNVSLKGKQGVMIMIDGKPTYLTGTQLATLLGSMNANQLDQIEIMTNPPAKYDAAGNSGIINIKTKKNKQKGWNGSLNLGFGQGSYWKTNNSLNLNYRNEKINAFVNYSQSINENYTDLHIVRTYLDETSKQPFAYFDQPTWLKRRFQNNTLKAGLDYSPTKTTTIGIAGTGFITKPQFAGNSTGYLQDADHVTDSSVTTLSNNKMKWTNGSLNLNLRQQFSAKSELTADLDYVHYTMANNQDFLNSAFDAAGNQQYANKLKGDLPAIINIYSAKADYSYTASNGLKLETGWKSSFVKTDNTADYFLENNGAWVPDYQKTNHFLYDENIHAAYANASKTIGKWSFQGGLRFEQTHYDGRQLGNPEKQDSAFSRNYGSLFPTAYITYNADSNHVFTLNAGRRIDRPAYQNLNPFIFYINEYTYEEGNPYLKPQFTYSVELSHTYRNWLTTSLNYSNTTQYFAQVFRTEGKVTILNQGNLARSRSVTFAVNAQLNPYPWWSANISASVLQQKVMGIGANSDFNSDAFSGQANLNNQFKLKKGWAAELSGFYNTKNIEGQFTIAPFGQVSAGISKQVFKTKGSLKLNVRDIFFTQVIKGDIRYGNVREHFVQMHDSRVVNLSFTWRFGKQFKENTRRSSGGSAEEQRRVGAGN
jgi:iron complex outermembrane receptor protein